LKKKCKRNVKGAKTLAILIFEQKRKTGIFKKSLFFLRVVVVL